MSLCSSAPAASLEFGAIAPRRTPVERLLELLRGEATSADLREAEDTAGTLAPAPRAPVNVLLL